MARDGVKRRFSAASAADAEPGVLGTCAAADGTGDVAWVIESDHDQGEYCL
jgi:hypothetical protein